MISGSAFHFTLIARAEGERDGYRETNLREENPVKQETSSKRRQARGRVVAPTQQWDVFPPFRLTICAKNIIVVDKRHTEDARQHENSTKGTSPIRRHQESKQKKKREKETATFLAT